MEKIKYQNPDMLCFSLAYGGGVYEWSGKYMVNPLNDLYESIDSSNVLCSPILTNKNTSEKYFMKRIECNKRQIVRYMNYIFNPPKCDIVLWPSDIVSLSESQAESCGLFVAHEYKENRTPAAKKKGWTAVLFSTGRYSPLSRMPEMINGQEKLAGIDRDGWKNEEIVSMAVQILKSIEELNRSGYIYADMHLSRFFFADSGYESSAAYLDFSNLILPVGKKILWEDDSFCSVDAGEYPLEFGDPAFVRGISENIDINSQNYSICALLFRLFFGRYPYAGRLLDGYADDDNGQDHYIKFRDYHKMPVFIFDSRDSSNALGAFDDERKIISLWDELPWKLKNMFMDSLGKENAETSCKVNIPSPGEWRDNIIKSIGRQKQ